MKKISSLLTASRGFLHAKSKTHVVCWNVQSLGSLSDQIVKLRLVIDSMSSKNLDLIALPESRWPGNGVSCIRGTTALYSGTDSTHVRGVAMLLSPRAKAAWDAVGNVFPVSTGKL